MNRKEQRAEIIEAIASFLTTDVAVKSIHLQMKTKYAEEWANIWQKLRINGYSTKEEVIKQLEEIL